MKRYYVGEKLKRLRGERSQEELAQYIKRSVKTISNWESKPSRCGIPEPDCYKIADFLGVSIHEFVGADPTTSIVADIPRPKPKPSAGTYSLSTALQVKPHLEVAAEPQRGEILLRLVVELVPMTEKEAPRERPS